MTIIRVLLMKYFILLFIVFACYCARASSYSDHSRGEYYEDGEYYEYIDYDEFAEILDKQTEKEEEASSRTVVLPIMYFLIAISGIVMNILAVIISQRCQFLKYSQRLFMQNLCLSSLILLITLLFSAQYRLLDDWQIGSIMCKVINCLKSLCIFAQSYFTTTICIDYVMLKTQFSTFSKVKRTIIEICVTAVGWLLAFGFSFPMLAFAENRSYADGKQHCRLFVGYDMPISPEDVNIVWSNTLLNSTYDELPIGSFTSNDQEILEWECKNDYDSPYLAWIVCGFVFSYVIPAMVVSGVLTVYKCFMLTHFKNEQNSANVDVKTKQKRENVHLRGMSAGVWVILMTVTYFVCWLPLHVYHLGSIGGFNISVSACKNLRDFCFVLAYLTCVLLPSFVIACSKPPKILNIKEGNGSCNSFASSYSGSSHRKASPAALNKSSNEMLLEQVNVCLIQNQGEAQSKQTSAL